MTSSDPPKEITIYFEGCLRIEYPNSEMSRQEIIQDAKKEINKVINEINTTSTDGIIETAYTTMWVDNKQITDNELSMEGP